MNRYILMALLSGVLVLQGCANHMKNSMSLFPGDSKQQALDQMGNPYDRSFNENNEAWQYMSVVGYGQCEYLTVWFQEARLHSITSRRGFSAAGCGLGSQPVDWGQFKPHPIQVELSVKNE